MKHHRLDVATPTATLSVGCYHGLLAQYGAAPSQSPSEHARRKARREGDPYAEDATLVRPRPVSAAKAAPRSPSIPCVWELPEVEAVTAGSSHAVGATEDRNRSAPASQRWWILLAMAIVMAAGACTIGRRAPPQARKAAALIRDHCEALVSERSLRTR